MKEYIVIFVSNDIHNFEFTTIANSEEQAIHNTKIHLDSTGWLDAFGYKFASIKEKEYNV